MRGQTRVGHAALPFRRYLQLLKRGELLFRRNASRASWLRATRVQCARSRPLALRAL